MRSMTTFLLFLALLAAAGTVLAQADDRRGMTVHDLVAMERLSDPQPSPDGKTVVFVRRTTDLEANRGRTDLWRISVDGGEPVQLTSHQASDSSPRWLPSGDEILFLSSRSGSSQVWRLALSGGEARPVTDLPLPVANLVVSPRGDRILFSAEVFPDCDGLQCTADRLAEEAEDKVSGRLYERLFVRHWDTWKDGRRSHLFSLSLSDDGAKPVDLSGSLDADVPSKPFGGAEEMTFSPDGAEVVFTARVAGAEEPWSTNFDLYRVPADGSGEPVNLTTANLAWDTHPVFSPDGRQLAYTAMERPGFEADRLRLVLQPWPTGEARVLTQEWDRSVRDFLFSADGKTLFVTAQDVGQVSLFAIDVARGAVTRLLNDGTVRSPSLAGDRLVFGRDTLTSPVQLYSMLPGESPVALTTINGERLAELDLGAAEQFSFAGWNDAKVHAYVVKPAGFDAEKKYPIAFLVHGGPQGSFGNSFHYRWNPQTYTGAGYAAVMVDFHGSTGYGQAFTDSITDDWGDKPLVDLQKGLAAALQRYPWLDGDRTCALGASYGGFMMNWIAGNWPDRFRCLVNHDGLFDHRMMYYTTEELWFPEWEHRGPYYAAAERHEAHNPVDHVEKWKTPMLVIHGALDYRVPETQGLATFTALQRRGVPSQLLFFPDENHWVLQPGNSILWHDTVLDWLERWIDAPWEGGAE
ncbi:MAG: S9 family peptidase [Acidobacteriota bacterium]